MQIGQGEPPDKAARTRLPNRRQAETISFSRDGSSYQMTIGFYSNGTIGELFLSADRCDSLLNVMVHDAAIAVSLALQHGCPLQTIAHAVKRNARDEPASPIGAALDRIVP